MLHQHAPMIMRWPNEANSSTRFCFVSDLHCFSSRSTATQHESLIEQVIDRSDVCVWGGDLFDFRWSQVGHEDDSIEAALEWLSRFYEAYPTKQFVFLTGNHDAHGGFAERLREWGHDRNRFLCGLDALVVRDTVFLHGDVIEGGGTDIAFANYRRTWQGKPVAHPHASKFYDAAVSARLHQAVAMSAHRRRRTCLRLARWINRQDSALLEPIERVVFGHTHRQIERYHNAGFEFHNGGAAIKHVKFKPVELVI
ncbi:metallophosphoesterase [Rubripirellula amarantea]|nr:metallophosphoesterase [Rubripirellula amarantea]